MYHAAAMALPEEYNVRPYIHFVDSQAVYTVQDK